MHRHHGRSVSIFGSVARGEETSTGDVDFLVEFEPGSSLFDLRHINDELESLLDVPVDVVSAGGLKTRDDHIRREAVPLGTATTTNAWRDIEALRILLAHHYHRIDVGQVWEIADGAVPELVRKLRAR